jgi:hypothetical protein
MVFLAVFVFVAIAATPAEAIEGPFYQRCKNVGAGNGNFEDNECSNAGGAKEWEKFRLLAGFPQIEGAAEKEFVLVGVGITKKCKKLKLEAAALVGEPPGNAGWSVEAIVFEECTVEGNGVPCEVYSEQNQGKKELGVIRTTPLTNTLDFPNAAPAIGDALLVYFAPVKGTVIAALKFTGAGCKVTSLILEGSVAGEALNSKKEPVKIGQTEVLGEVNYVNFPKAFIKNDFIEEAKVLKAVKPSLKMDGIAATEFKGTMEVKLATKEHWGIFT